MLTAAWRYRQFIVSSIRTDYRTRFARSRLGTFWMVVHPLVNAAIYVVILAEVMSARLPGMTNDRLAYAMYLLAGMLGWSLFSEVVTRCLGIFVDNGNLLKKLLFPRICLPLIVTGSALLNNLLLFAAVLVIFGVLGRPPGIDAIWIPVLSIVPLMLGIGIGLLLAVFNVFVRDVAQVVPVALQLGFWLTPIVYVPSLLSAKFAAFLRLNPMTPVVESYQNVLVWDRAPAWLELAWVVVLALALLALALLIFRRASADLVDAL